jgi:hypothetical protein
MLRMIPQWLTRSVGGTVALVALAACAGDAPLSPGANAVLSGSIAAARATELGACDTIAVPDGHKLKTQLYAQGVQLYRWDGTTWVFVAPDAKLSADRAGHDQVGTHFAGPTWQSTSGSYVIGAVVKRCTPDANSIPWLLLAAAKSDGPGIFRGVTYIQRIRTQGGIAPATPGNSVGEIRGVPYTTEYLFYRAH